MKNRVKPLILIILFLVSMVSGPASSTQEEDNAQTATPLAEWTFMVYLAADNNLEGPGVEDLNEMETVGSSKDLNIIVQIDRAKDYDTSNGDWEGAKRYRVEKDDDQSTIGSTELEDMGEINMGDPQTLVDFIKWAQSTYPAKRYFLDLWDHGGAFWGVCWDDAADDFISMVELKDALLEIRKETRTNIDIIGFDACLMAQMGVLYQIRDFADYSVASGFVEPGDGWPYETIFATMEKEPTISPRDLGSEIVNVYIDSYTNKQDDPTDSPVVSMALFDMSKMSALAQAVNHLAMVLSTENVQHNGQVKLARSYTECYAYPDIPGPIKVTRYTLFDLQDLVDNLDTLIPFDQSVRTALAKVNDKIRDAILESRCDRYHPRAHGLSIYMPNGKDVKYDEEFDTLDFSVEGYWDDYLSFFSSALSGADNTPPTLTMAVKPGKNLTLSNAIFDITGTVLDLQGKPDVFVKIDDGEWVEGSVFEEGDDLAWEYPWALTDVSSGNHTISAKARDSQGDESAILTVDVFVEPTTTFAVTKTVIVDWWWIVMVVFVFAVVAIVVARYARRKK